jgi:hypothetical protein
LSNKAYFTNQKILKSNLVSKKIKLNLYWTTIRIVITYVSGTWVLKGSVKRK